MVVGVWYNWKTNEIFEVFNEIAEVPFWYKWIFGSEERLMFNFDGIKYGVYDWDQEYFETQCVYLGTVED